MDVQSAPDPVRHHDRLGYLDAERLSRLIAALGRAAKGPGQIFLTGGSTVFLVGWRASTVDVDMKLDPLSFSDAVADFIRQRTHG